MDNEQQATILALVVTALKAARAIRKDLAPTGDFDERPLADALEQDAQETLRALVSPETEVTAAGLTACVQALETAQMALRTIDDLEGVDMVQELAFKLIDRAAPPLRDELRDCFTWGLADEEA